MLVNLWKKDKVHKVIHMTGATKDINFTPLMHQNQHSNWLPSVYVCVHSVEWLAQLRSNNETTFYMIYNSSYTYWQNARSNWQCTPLTNTQVTRLCTTFIYNATQTRVFSALTLLAEDRERHPSSENTYSSERYSCGGDQASQTCGNCGKNDLNEH